MTARVEAAHVARYVDGDHDQADQLFAAAQQWADAHGHGAGTVTRGNSSEDGAA